MAEMAGRRQKRLAARGPPGSAAAKMDYRPFNERGIFERAREEFPNAESSESSFPDWIR